MRAAERRDTWLAGRIAAKQLLASVFAAENSPLRSLPPNALHIESRSTNPGHGERPVLYADDYPHTCAISIAHSSRGVLVAVTLDEQVHLGVDLVEPLRAAENLHWTFTAPERAWLAGNDRTSAARLWALKESLYKACQRGESFSPQQIEVAPGRPPRYPERDLPRDLRTWQTWRVDGHVAALAIVARDHAQQGLRPLELSRAA
jgi:phosphopantetheinyl transferase